MVGVVIGFSGFYAKLSRKDELDVFIECQAHYAWLFHARRVAHVLVTLVQGPLANVLLAKHVIEFRLSGKLH